MQIALAIIFICGLFFIMHYLNIKEGQDKKKQQEEYREMVRRGNQIRQHHHQKEDVNEMETSLHKEGGNDK